MVAEEREREREKERERERERKVNLSVLIYHRFSENSLDVAVHVISDDEHQQVHNYEQYNESAARQSC